MPRNQLIEVGPVDTAGFIFSALLVSAKFGRVLQISVHYAFDNFPRQRHVERNLAQELDSHQSDRYPESLLQHDPEWGIHVCNTIPRVDGLL